MKKIFSILVLCAAAILVYSQENMITISGGYAFANMEDTEINGTGWRINVLYEFSPMDGTLSHGFSFGFIKLSAEETGGLYPSTYDIGTWPVYYAPKFLFGSEYVKGFIKGALGMQFSNIERTGLLELSDSDYGFAGGGGAGVLYWVNDTVSIHAEYELLWMSNSFYRDGLMNSVNIGVGYKF